MESLIIEQLTALGHPQRLAVFRLLMRRFPDRVPAGEIAQNLGIKGSTLSSYLATLQHAGLISQHRDGTSLLYGIDQSRLRAMMTFLVADCCRGRPGLCPPLDQGATAMTDRQYKVLFICVGNSARSIFAETLLRETAGDRFDVYSAGTRPATTLNPIAISVLQDKGHDISHLRAKHISEFTGPNAPHFDFVFTVCNQAANEECPPWDGQPISGHWGMPDPVKVEGTEAEKALAFQQAYGALKHRIEAFAALPVQSLDRIALQTAVDEIGRMSSETGK
ncbi:helix-turn-helix domain-containing protein [Pseudothioclava nitratireducens]|uniref:arsenate reductase/protein-tyrosine-phosphatase family protein n=1 Tax=Pseudothioclava nitratireducens TaxID=1928646 RepID=UPI0023DA25CD|nr:helix-turn-helix domain-containing protein [Defluviimonas nitratireducens]MDF1619768.1 helix-turn-helix domain-containing protein [Defluviimonas nitratireducens]